MFFQFYEKVGVFKDCVLIKIVFIWEGIKVVEIFQCDYGININFIFMFFLVQVIVVVEVGVFLIFFFVGCIFDWFKVVYKKEYKKEEDFGVVSVKSIFNYYKKFGYKMIVMGVFFCNIGEIIELVGCDYFIIFVSYFFVCFLLDLWLICFVLIV